MTISIQSRVRRTALMPSAVLLALAASAVAQSSDVLTPHDVARLEHVTSAAISPNAMHVAYTVSVPREPGVDEDGPAWSELHVLDQGTGETRAYVTDKSGVGSVEWTKDGRGIAFLSKRDKDEGRALYVLPIDGGEARRALALESSISSYSFAADGRRVAVVATDPESAEAKAAKKKGFAQEVYEEDWRDNAIWIANAFDDAEPRRVDVDGFVYQVHWCPVDDRLAITVAPTPLVDDQYMRQRVRVIDSNTGEVLAKIENPGKLGAIGWSPDGKYVTLISGEDINDPKDGRLWIAPAAGGAFVDLLPGLEGHVTDFAWQSNEELLFVAGMGVWTRFGEVNLQGAWNALAEGVGGPILHGLSVSRDGKSAAFVGDAPDHASEVFTMSHGEQAPARRTNVNPWLDRKRLAPQELVKFQARDGLDLEGLLIRPLDEVAGQRYPLILAVHGGPEAHHSNGWLTSYSAPGQVAAARGIAVFYTNYRGSTGRGVAFSKLSQGEPAGPEFDDLIDAVDHLIATGLVDGDKVGVMGGSYGGYATAWLSTRYTDRIAAGCMFVGISDKISKVGTTDIADEEFYVHARKRPWDNWQFFLERSPIYHAKDAKTPLLILHGKEDPRVDPGQSRELYRHLKVHGQAPVRLVLYPGEGHGNRKAGARLDYNLRTLRWMQHYLQGEGGAMPDYDLDHEEVLDHDEVETSAGL